MPNVTVTKTTSKNPETGQTIKVVTREIQQPDEPPVKPLVEGDVNFQAYALLGVVCAVAAWGIVEVIKEFVKARLKVKGASKPWYYLAMIRSLSIGIGGLSGYMLSDSFGAGTKFAVMAGCAAGAMSTVIVGVIKAKAKKAVSK